MINWKVRIKNELFWLALVPAVLMLVASICDVFGIQLDLTELQARLVELVKAIFAVLAILGIVVDPTTSGVCDSDQAMTYDKPKE